MYLYKVKYIIRKKYKKEREYYYTKYDMILSNKKHMKISLNFHRFRLHPIKICCT